jgi:hypothetical protein
MQRVSRWVGAVYGGFFVSFLYWSLRRGLEPIPNQHRRLLEELTVPELAGVCLMPLLGLLISHRFVRRSRYRSAAVILALCVCLSASNLIAITDSAWNRTLPNAVSLRRKVVSALPLGSDVSMVLRFLQRNGIECGGCEAGTRQLSSTIRVCPRGGLGFIGVIQVVFRFDAKQKLVGTDVKEEWIAW